MTFPLNTRFCFTSPRRNVGKRFETVYITEDNQYYDKLNGTYDRLFPLYALNTIQGADAQWRPKIELISGNNTKTTMQGALEPSIFKDDLTRRALGKKDEVHPTLANRNLETQITSYREFTFPQFSPAWSVIQMLGTQPTYLVNCLGDINTTRQYQVVSLGKKPTAVVEPFKRNVIVEYKGNIWRCLEETSEYPPELDTAQSELWRLISITQTIFNADIYVLIGNQSEYLNTYTEGRNFSLDIENLDNTLESWNIACYYS